MVARLIEGWESSTAIADYAGKWTSFTSSANVTIGSAGGRFGNGLRVASQGGVLHYAARVFDAQATWVVGFAFRTSGLPSSTPALCYFVDGATVHCGLAVQDSTGLLVAWRGAPSTVLGTASAGVLPNVWNYLELKVTISDSAGVFGVRLNGATVLNLTAQDTRNAGNASANTVRLGHQAGLTTGVTFDYDDLYVFDGTGSVNNDFAGDCRVEQLLPTGAGATTAWTPSAGANYACVDDVPPNGDTDYVSSATAAQTDTYAFGNLAVASGTVKAVQATVQARKDDAGSRSVALVARPGSTDRLGATQSVGDTYSGFTEMWSVNPDTAAAWTVAEVNASQFGIRLVS